MTIEGGDLAGVQHPRAARWRSSHEAAPEARPFEIEIERDCDRVDVRLIGELDGRTRRPFDHLVAMLGHERPSEVILDLRRLRFIDTGGQREILLLWQRSTARGCDFRLVAASDDVRARFRTTGVDKLLQLAPK
jgi:anti-anti-sigma factor